MSDESSDSEQEMVEVKLIIILIGLYIFNEMYSPFIILSVRFV